MLTPWKKSHDQPRQHIKKQRHYFANKGLSSQSCGFSRVMYGCGSWSWGLKNWCFWTVVWRILQSPLDCKEIQPVKPKGNQSMNIHWRGWCWSWNSNTLATWYEELTRKDPDAGKDWRKEGKGITEDEVVGWQHQLEWVWVSFRSWTGWWTGKPGVLQSIWLQRVSHDLVTELTYTDTWILSSQLNLLAGIFP